MGKALEISFYPRINIKQVKMTEGTVPATPYRHCAECDDNVYQSGWYRGGAQISRDEKPVEHSAGY